MKIKTLVLASCLSFSMNSFAANSNTVETSEKSKKESAGLFKWCGENKGKCGAVISGLSLFSAVAILGYGLDYKYELDDGGIILRNGFTLYGRWL